MELKKFPIGFWNYTPTGMLGADAVKDWKDLGMTFALSPEYFDGCDKNDMLAILDECAKEEIPVIICDHRTRFWGASKNPEKAEADFKAAYDDFGHHPATLGFHVGDEPWGEERFDDAITEHNIQLKVAPDLTPHLNFLPYWAGQEEGLGYPTFTDWAKAMAEKTKLKILCYDCYSQMNPEEEGTNNYYLNLRKFSEAADATGITPWTTLLSVGHFRYRVPNEDDLRWQLNTAVASGMKGIMWFFIYMRAPKSNYRLSPIDEFGERTETFTYMSRVNRHFLHQFGDFFMNAEHLATYHTVKAYGGYGLFEENKTDDRLINVTCDQNIPAVVGIFRLDGKKYYAVVNNSVKESGMFKLHIAKNSGKLLRYNWNLSLSDMKFDRWDAFYGETEFEEIGGDWLAPGQLKLYTIE